MGDLVSVIITTKNEEAVLERLLISIKNQTYKDVEIVVVDNDSKDKTKEIAHKHTRLVFNKGPERSAQRNYGVNRSKGKYLFILDADMELTLDVINECIQVSKKNERVGAITIPEDSVAENYWEKVKSFERSFYNLEGDETTDAARFFTREAFDGAGGYDEAITGPEDWDLPETIKKLGYKQVRIKSKIFHYERVRGPISVAKKKYYYALKSHRYLTKQNISAFSAKTIFFLRPVFYKYWRRLITHPLLSIGMLIMLSLELVFGAYGYLFGKFKNL